jgi:formylglycine-generating enzyme required for sulfatase activity
MKTMAWLCGSLLTLSASAAFADNQNSIGMTFVSISAGSFEQGCDEVSSHCEGRATPKHSVRIERSFSVSTTEVTQAQWQAVMAYPVGEFHHLDEPVDLVSYADVQAFLAALNTKENCQGCYRLPTESEWEYLASSGGNSFKQAYYGHKVGGPRRVALGKPDRNGLYDVLGNVAEWTQDWYRKDQYQQSNPSQAPSSGELKVVRGGAWNTPVYAVSPVIRRFETPDTAKQGLGFRVVRDTSGGNGGSLIQNAEPAVRMPEY